MTTETVSWPASQANRIRMIRLCCPKPLCGYPIPACCHGNAVRDLNTSLCPLPTSLLSSSFHSSRLSPRFLWVGVLTLSHALSLSHVSSGIVSLPHLALSSPAKWHFTGCFLLLIPCYFASCDSVKSSCKMHTATQSRLYRHTRDKLQLLTVYTHTRNYFNIYRQMREWSQAHTNTSSNSINKSERSTYSMDAATAYTCWQSAANEDLSFSAKASSSRII